MTPPVPIIQVPGAPPAATPPGTAPPVSAQGSPTPVVTIPPQPPAGTPTPILISSGGGSPVPSTAPITLQTGGDVTSRVAAWPKGSTVSFNYHIPNAILRFPAVRGFDLRA